MIRGPDPPPPVFDGSVTSPPAVAEAHALRLLALGLGPAQLHLDAEVQSLSLLGVPSQSHSFLGDTNPGVHESRRGSLKKGKSSTSRLQVPWQRTAPKVHTTWQGPCSQ